MASVMLKNIYKCYEKDVTAVKDFNMQIADKEFIVLVGPSGCGKSTTLRMIAGLEDITQGELFIDGKLVNDVPPKDRDIAMVFQNYALYPHMTVYENMAFALKLRKFSKNDIAERVGKAANILGIEELLKRKPKQLSGGQRQRVAIGRAIVREPQVFLMDEPLSNLDAKLRGQMRAELIKLHKDLDTTFIYVTHDQIEAMTLGTRIVVMKDGIIQQAGKPHDIFETPANVFVAGFIGSPQMNFFEDAELIVKNAVYTVSLFDRLYALPDDKQALLRAKNQPECKVIAGIRPEDFMVGENNDNSIKTKLDVSELMGSEVYLHVKIREQEAVLRAKAEYVDMRLDTVDILPNTGKIHIFDQDSKHNLLL